MRISKEGVGQQLRLVAGGCCTKVAMQTNEVSLHSTAVFPSSGRVRPLTSTHHSSARLRPTRVRLLPGLGMETGRGAAEWSSVGLRFAGVDVSLAQATGCLDQHPRIQFAIFPWNCFASSKVQHLQLASESLPDHAAPYSHVAAVSLPIMPLELR